MSTNNMLLKSELDAKDLLLLESEVKNRGKSMLVAYVLWYFLGMFGGHRFYLGRKGSAIAMLILTLTVVGIVVTSVWALVDAFLTYKMVQEFNNRTESAVLTEIVSGKRGMAAL
jgi:TM2 domain-containing membrane protein YozV